MGVEWLRFCHAGGWRFWRDQPNRISAGRYYACEKDAPVLPFPHHFGSPVWTQGDEPRYHAVGPSPNTPIKWTTRDLGTDFPGTRPIGNVTDFTAPNAPYAPTQGFPWRLGIPEFCWFSNTTLLIDPVLLTSIGSCCLTLAYARLIDLLYDNELEKFTDFITAWIGGAPAIHFYSINGLLPAFALVMHPLFSLVVIAGTDNSEQLATQAFQGAIPPTDQGGVSTIPLWYNTGTFIFTELMNHGSSGNEQLVITGHSYGAAVASVMAMRATLKNPSRSIHLLTFASPKPSNEVGIDLLDNIKHRHIANYGDLVTVVPTNLIEGLMFAGIVGNPIALIWGSWSTFKASEIYRGDGTHFVAKDQNLGYNVLLPAVLRYVAGLDWSPVAFHPIKEYIRRLSILCAGPCWPIPIEPWTILFGPGTTGHPVIQIGAPAALPGAAANEGGILLSSADVAAPASDQGGVVLYEDTFPYDESNTYRNGVQLG